MPTLIERNPELMAKVELMHREGKSMEEIRKEVSRILEKEVSTATVWNYLKVKGQYITKSMIENPELKEVARRALEEAISKTIKQLDYMSVIMGDTIKDLQNTYELVKNTEDMKDKVAYAEQILKTMTALEKNIDIHVKMLNSLTAQLAPTEFEVNYLDFSSKMNEHLKKLSDAGFISINSKLPDEYTQAYK